MPARIAMSPEGLRVKAAVGIVKLTGRDMKTIERVEEREKERKGQRWLGTNRARVLATTSALLERDNLLLLPNQLCRQLMPMCKDTRAD
jgi:hypothetical protein